MRISTLLVLLGAVSLSASALAAPPAAVAVANSATMVTVQTIQGQHYQATPAELAGITGNYNLANGQTLRVSVQQRKLFAEVGDKKAEIVAVAPNTFASRADDMTLVFDELPFANEVKLSRR